MSDERCFAVTGTAGSGPHYCGYPAKSTDANGRPVCGVVTVPVDPVGDLEPPKPCQQQTRLSADQEATRTLVRWLRSHPLLGPECDVMIADLASGRLVLAGLAVPHKETP